MILDGLNLEQQEAVQHIDGPLLLLAGAGSGKTRTITRRLAYLIDEVGIPASSILCLTFTNKASAEMRNRAFELIKNHEGLHPLLCTFHKFGLFFLKDHISLLERPSSFVLLDSDDVKRVIRSFKSSIAPSQILGYISYCKNQALSPQEILKQAKSQEFREVAELYWRYQEYLEEKNLLDFDDLLYFPYLILDRYTALREEISKKYQYIMVDEYQDTNILQYKLLKLLTSTHRNLCVVGDEDQSIYSWRGADIRNILEFERDFQDARVIKLEKNYRSTPQILEFANNLISYNTQRLGKTLYAIQEDGESVQIEKFESEKEEIDFVIQEICRLILKGVSYEDIGILYRLNALSRNIEEGFNRHKIPYQLIGAIRFYERAEIKDALSYLRLMINKNDDFSLLRVLNKPKRGIGKISQERLQADAQGKSIYTYFCQSKTHIAPKIEKILEDFFTLLDHLCLAYDQGIDFFITTFQEKIPLLSEYCESEKEDRQANLDELFGLLREFKEQNPELSLEDFLNELSLSSDADHGSDGKVSCMSMHSSKGLEFDYVFVLGCEEGIFPVGKDGEEMEEERRLGYVAFTRAKKKLILSSVSSRYYKGKRELLVPSRFLREASHKQTQILMYKGALVRHKVFGTGRVEGFEGQGERMKVQVNFGGNYRVILASFLEILE